MTPLIDLFHRFGEWLLTNSMHAALLAGLILALQRLFRKRLSPNWVYGLWLLLILKLVAPWSPESSLSLFGYFSFEQMQSGDSAASEIGGSASNRTAPSSPPFNNADFFDKDQDAALLADFDFFTIFVFLWLAVAFFLFAYSSFKNFRLLHAIKRRRPVVDDRILNVLENCKAELNVYVPINIVVTDRVESPALLGYIRPRLLMPKDVLNSLSEADLRYVFLHELAHIKRKDIFANWVIAFLQTLHWFNPFLWLAFNRMRSDLEIACDYFVLSSARKKENQAYGKTMLKVLELASRLNPLPGAVGLLEDKKYMHRRMLRISHSLTPKKGAGVAACAIAIFFAGTVFTNPRTPDAPAAIVEQFKEAFEAKDIEKLSALFHDGAVYQEIDLQDKPLNTASGKGLEQTFRQKFLYTSRFTFSNVRSIGDTIAFKAAFRTGNFEVVGAYESEGFCRFILENGKIQTMSWQEAPSLKKQRREVFDQFVNWLKTERPQKFKEVFGSDLFISYRAQGEEVNALFFEWIKMKSQSNEQQGKMSMSTSLEAKRITLEKDIVALVKEFTGPYENSPQYVTEVQSYATEKGVSFGQHNVFGIYTGDPQKDKPEDLKSIQGVLIDEPVEVDAPYFIYTMKKGTDWIFVRTQPGEQAIGLQQGYGALFTFIGMNQIQAGASGGHQFAKMNDDGEIYFDIYLEVDGE